MLHLLTLATGFVAGPLAPRAAPALRSLPQPVMLAELDVQSALLAKQSLAASSMHLADSHFSLPSSMNIAETVRKSIKSEGDELLEELFVFFPVVIAGGALTAFALEYIKNFEGKELLPEALTENQFFALIAVSVGAGGFVVLTKTGVLSFLAGALAKGLLDGWNLFANLALKGALLKY